jgi:hypothetical protein
MSDHLKIDSIPEKGMFSSAPKLQTMFGVTKNVGLLFYEA